MGWICLHRKIQESDVWLDEEPFDKRSAWVDLLLLANHKDNSMIFDGHKLVVERGQIVTSVRKLSLRWNRSVKWTLKVLRLFEELEMIEKKSDNKKTLLTIVNYGVYQDGGYTEGNTTDNTEETQRDTQRITQRKRRGTTNNNDNNAPNNELNNGNNVNNKYYPEDELLNEAFEGYVAMRKEIKKPLTSKAIELAKNKLSKLSCNDSDTAIAILNQSVLNSWQGLFPLREEKKEEPRSIVNEWRIAGEELERRRSV